jgi:hypothetical protein
MFIAAIRECACRAAAGYPLDPIVPPGIVLESP